jgi:hypothetical protein
MVMAFEVPPSFLYGKHMKTNEEGQTVLCHDIQEVLSSYSASYSARALLPRAEASLQPHSLQPFVSLYSLVTNFELFFNRNSI